MRILLIRHGDTQYPTNEQGIELSYGSNDPLTEKGRKQAIKLSELITQRNIPLTQLITSPHTRALQTVQILADKLKVPLTTNKDLRDTYLPGWYGVPRKERFKGDIYSTAPRTPDQETEKQVAQRSKEVLQRILHEQKDSEAGKEGVIGIVTHEDVIRMIVYGLEHPNEEIPRVIDIFDYAHLDNAWAWDLTINEGGILVKRELISFDNEIIEREIKAKER